MAKELCSYGYICQMHASDVSQLVGSIHTWGSHVGHPKHESDAGDNSSKCCGFEPL